MCRPCAAHVPPMCRTCAAGFCGTFLHALKRKVIRIHIIFSRIAEYPTKPSGTCAAHERHMCGTWAAHERHMYAADGACATHMIAGALRMRAVCCRADRRAILCRPSEHHGARRRARSAARRDHAPTAQAAPRPPSSKWCPLAANSRLQRRFMSCTALSLIHI